MCVCDAHQYTRSADENTFQKSGSGETKSVVIVQTSSTAQSSTPTVRCSTPMPEDCDTSDNNSDDVWNPNSAAPRSDQPAQIERPTHWLEHDKLKNTRVQLFLRDKPGHILEFKGVVGDQAKIRDMLQFKQVALEDLFAVAPSAVGDLVTPITGPMTGVALKIKEFRDEYCVVYRPGRVLRKKETDPILPISSLVRIYPYK